MLEICKATPPYFQAAYALFCQYRHKPWSLELFTASLNQPYSLIALNDHVLVGLIIVGHVLDEAEIEDICVAVDTRRQGIAKRLLNTCMAELQSQNISVLHLEVRQSNFAAIALYKSLGFKHSGKRTGYYEKPQSAGAKGVAEAALLYRYDLEHHNF